MKRRKPSVRTRARKTKTAPSGVRLVTVRFTFPPGLTGKRRMLVTVDPDGPKTAEVRYEQVWEDGTRDLIGIERSKYERDPLQDALALPKPARTKRTSKPSR